MVRYPIPDGKSKSVCASPGCGKPAAFQCPRCVAVSLPPSKFCSQECFKGAWPVHKLIHVVATTSRDGLPPIFNGFSFTGSVRPGVVSPRRAVPPEIPRPDYAETGEPLSERALRGSTAIEVNTPEQIEIIREACRLGREILDLAAAAVKPGVTTDEIDRIVHEATIERHAYPSPLNYRGFPKSCCTSVNEIICHGIPDSRELQEGDIVNIDVCLYYKGMHADLNETYFVGEVDEKSKFLVRTTYDALHAAIATVKPGALYRDLGNTIQNHINKTGLSIVRSYCGHGVGRVLHASAPSVPHYGKNKAVGVMKPGHTFTIEPMINEGTWHDVTWPDDWTSATRDGKRSAQFEHTLLVTETGVDILTARLPTSRRDVGN